MTLEYDHFWLSVRDYLKETFDGQPIVAPVPLNRDLRNVVAPQDLGETSFDKFAAIVIHKGDLEKYPAQFLFHALASCRLVFMNGVFVVTAVPGPDLPPGIGEAHVEEIAELIEWARQKAGPGVTLEAIPPEVSLTREDAMSRMGRLVVEDLAKPIAGYGSLAVSETAESFMDSHWFWGDDAAKVVEMFAVPHLQDAHPELTSELIDLIGKMSDSTLIHRRIGKAELLFERDKRCNFEVKTPFVTTRGDLSRAQIDQSIRFNDGRSRTLAEFRPGTLKFRWHDRTAQVDIGESVFHSSIERSGETVVLQQFATIRDPDDITREIAVVVCNWKLEADSNVLDFTLELRPHETVRLDKITYATDWGDTCQRCDFDRVTSSFEGNSRSIKVAEASSTLVADRNSPPGGLIRGDIDYLCLWESRTIPGNAVGLHIATGTGARPSMVLAGHSKSGVLQMLEIHYEVPHVSHEAPFTVNQQIMLTAGGYYRFPETYQQLMNARPRSGWCLDPSMSYDTGVELNAMATYLSFAKGDGDTGSLDDGEISSQRAWFDRHLALYIDHVRPEDPGLHERMFVRGLAFAILAVDTMARTLPSGGYKETSLRLANALLRTEIPVAGSDNAGIFSNGPSDDPSRPELDSQCAALLALARMAFTVDDNADLSAAIERGLLAIRVAVPKTSRYGNNPLDFPTLVLSKDMADDDRVDTGYWTYKLGLALRAFRLIGRAVALGVVELSDEAKRHLERLTEVATQSLMKSVRCQDGRIEVLTSVHAGETNSETQPWAALGLASTLDELVLGIPEESPAAKLTFPL
ncbi:hypothetical protein [Aurantiacibacter poecillastricola]|uniref:hypothetical protein n=1 Tax=Aurantiacibacter poecillastricola TaxID=3064385 RepID=UPI00273F9AAB|nr:hypothetical protein [Aurantiacibacter sp. 219JJ12-13]MDP5262269.1 hypothetical protein [Aurantiacibacter sp. 219JJ12-13]